MVIFFMAAFSRLPHLILKFVHVGWISADSTRPPTTGTAGESQSRKTNPGQVQCKQRDGAPVKRESTEGPGIKPVGTPWLLSVTRIRRTTRTGLRQGFFFFLLRWKSQKRGKRWEVKPKWKPLRLPLAPGSTSTICMSPLPTLVRWI